MGLRREIRRHTGGDPTVLDRAEGMRTDRLGDDDPRMSRPWKLDQRFAIGQPMPAEPAQRKGRKK